MNQIFKILIIIFFNLWNFNSYAIYYSSNRFTNSGDPKYIGLAGSSAASKNVSFSYYNNPSIIGLQEEGFDPTFILYQGTDNSPAVQNSIPSDPNNIIGIGLGISYKINDKIGLAVALLNEKEGFSSQLQNDTVHVSTNFLNLNVGYKLNDNLNIGLGISQAGKVLERDNNTGSYSTNFFGYRIIFASTWLVREGLLFNFIYYPKTILSKSNGNEDISFIEPGKLQIGGLYAPNIQINYFSIVNIMSQLQLFYFNIKEVVYTPYSLLNENSLNTLFLNKTLADDDAKYTLSARLVPKIGLQMIKEYSKIYNYEILLGTYLEPSNRHNTSFRPHFTFGLMSKLNYINLGFSTDFGYSDSNFKNYFLLCLSLGINFDAFI
ncbi:hypothetical protein [Fluviispira multicolorata]|uniref:Uncharacterized protein n=1 Tax=Fluviispira multicolorata TaxID=2654512 RepID=A0A833JFK3_9BACT|nr:hypothetical protein [Fluviispira multicolorata]KAB8033438.1 hypothetical protein GCL57_01680 [Fluviispira multicolorata]